MLKSILICAVLSTLMGCATSLSPLAEKVQIVTAAQKEKCQTVKLVTSNQRLGPDKLGNAMKAVLNEAAFAGGNAFYVMSSSADGAEGASLVGEALRCKGLSRRKVYTKGLGSRPRARLGQGSLEKRLSSTYARPPRPG